MLSEDEDIFENIFTPKIPTQSTVLELKLPEHSKISPSRVLEQILHRSIEQDPDLGHSSKCTSSQSSSFESNSTFSNLFEDIHEIPRNSGFTPSFKKTKCTEDFVPIEANKRTEILENLLKTEDFVPYEELKSTDVIGSFKSSSSFSNLFEDIHEIQKDSGYTPSSKKTKCSENFVPIEATKRTEIFEELLKTENFVLYEELKSTDAIGIFEEKLKKVDLRQEAENFMQNPTESSIYWPDFEYYDRKLFQNDVIPDLKKVIRECLQRELEKEITSELLGFSENTENKICSEKIETDHHTDGKTSPNMFSSEDEDREECSKANPSKELFEELKEISVDDNTPIPLPFISEEGTQKVSSERSKIFIEKIEQIIQGLLQTMVNKEPMEYVIRDTIKKSNCYMNEDVLTLKPAESSTLRKISLSNKKSEFRFAIITFLLSEIYELLQNGTTCTMRELYYKNPDFVKDQINISLGINNICCLLGAAPWELGVLSASKGLIAGQILLTLATDEIIDCSLSSGGILLPVDTTGIKLLESTAKYVLLVEKDTVYEKLLKQNIFKILGRNIILITGKGFPDINTRVIIKKISDQLKIPIYALFDADPYGIEILFVYKYGSRAMSFNADFLACPKIQWIGIHPSEIDLLGIPAVTLNEEDRNRIRALLERPYLNADVRKELLVLQKGDRKAEIEGVSSFSTNYLISEYIPNKIKLNFAI